VSAVVGSSGNWGRSVACWWYLKRLLARWRLSFLFFVSRYLGTGERVSSGAFVSSVCLCRELGVAWLGS